MRLIHKFFFGAMASGLLLTGCQSDPALQPDNQGQIDKTECTTLYVNMNIHGNDADGTRAGDDAGEPTSDPTFDAGTGESQVKEAYFVFYDADGKIVGEIVKINLSKAEEVAGSDGSVEKQYRSIVPVSVYKGENDPTQVVCYINPITPASLQNPLDVIQTNARDILYTTSDDGTKYFAMSNSVYYPAQTEGQLPQVAVPVAKDQLFNSEAEARAALSGSDASAVVDIYVERYAAKLKFQHADPAAYNTFTSPINSNDEIPVTLQFVPKCWALNAACQETYIVKSFRQEATTGGVLPDNYGFDALNKRINASKISGTAANIDYGTILGTTESWTWNSPVFRRSFWAMSPAYFTQDYPEVSADVTGELESNLSQHYYSYNELLGTNGVGISHSATPVAHYFHETTVGARGLVSHNPAAAVPSVILVGDYTIKLNNTDLAAGTTFYTYLSSSTGSPLVYFEAAANDAQGKSAVTGGESMIRRFIEQTSILFKKVDGTYLPFDVTNTADMATLVAALEVAAPAADVRGDMKVAERYRTLQFKQGANTAGIYVATTDGYNTIGATADAANNVITLTTANQALMQQIGFCSMYNTGSAYFNIPVKHLGWYRAGNTQKNATKIDWDLVRVGDFGIVRNHSYNINVSQILGLGTGIGGHDSPIVPPAVTKDYFVAYSVHVLKWAVVPTQSVILE